MIYIESIQIREKGFRAYFSRVFNIIDFLNFFGFVAYVVLRLRKTDHLIPKDDSHDKNDNVNEIILMSVLNSLLLIFSAFKTFFFIRVYENYGQLVELVTQVTKDIMTFSLFFFSWVLLFSFLY